MSDDKREPRSIVMDGPMPPATDETAGVIGTPLPRATEPIGTEPAEGSLGEFYEGSLGEAYQVTTTRRAAGQQRALASRETERLRAHVSAEYNSIQQLVRLMREVGLTNQTILGVLNGVPAAVEMARTTLSLQAPAQEFQLRNNYLRASEAVSAVAGSQAAIFYLRSHLEELSRSQNYEEIVQNQEHRRDVQEQMLRERLAQARLSEAARPSDEIMQRLVERQAEARVNTGRSALSDILLNQQQLADIRRWGRDEVDADTRRDVMMGVSMITTPAVQEDEQDRRLREQVQREIGLLYDWAWVEITNVVSPPHQMTDTIAHSRRELENFNEATRFLFQTFGVRATIGFNEESICRENMQLALSIDTPQARDIHGRRICGSLMWHPAVLMIVNEDNRYDFANYGHRTRQAEGAGNPDARQDHLRGRDGGSSSHAAVGDAERRDRLLNLDL